MDLSMFTPEQIEALKVALLNSNGNRSPIRERQLHDLRRPPAHNDPRPLFVLSAETPVNFNPAERSPYAQLMWNRQTGDEITVHSEAERAAHADAYTTEQPSNRVLTQSERVSELLQSLSPEDRALVVKAQQAKRMEAVTDAMSALNDDQLAAVMKAIQPVAGRKTA